MGEAMRPFLWLATVFFLIGFVGYLTLGQPSGGAHAAPAAFEATSDIWADARPA